MDAQSGLMILMPSTVISYSFLWLALFLVVVNNMVVGFHNASELVDMNVY